MSFLFSRIHSLLFFSILSSFFSIRRDPFFSFSCYRCYLLPYSKQDWLGITDRVTDNAAFPTSLSCQQKKMMPTNDHELRSSKELPFNVLGGGGGCRKICYTNYKILWKFLFEFIVLLFKALVPVLAWLLASWVQNLPPLVIHGRKILAFFQWNLSQREN